MDNNITENIRLFLTNELGLQKKISNEDELFTSGILDSLDILSLLTFFEKEFNTKFSPFEIGLEQLNTIDLMVNAINSKV